MAAVDPINPELRRFSIRLPRPLWIGVATVVLVVVGIALQIGLPIYREYAAIREIERLGGNVEIEIQSASPKWLPLANVVWVGLAGTPATDATVVQTGRLSSLRWLILDGTRVTDAGLANLEKLTVLEGLDLSNAGVTDAGLQHLKPLTALQYLRLGGTQVTEAGAAELKRALPRLTISGNGSLIK
jgi:hypothetical protein